MRSASGTSVLLTRSIADAIAGVNKDLALTFRPLSDQIGASLTQERVVALLAGFFGALALLLAGLGLYGVTSYAVSRRRTEIGIRMALGAAPAGVVRLVLSRVSMLVGLGVLIGAGVSFWASQFVATLLYGLEPRDPVTLAGWSRCSPRSAPSPDGCRRAVRRASIRRKCCETASADQSVVSRRSSVISRSRHQSSVDSRQFGQSAVGSRQSAVVMQTETRS